MADSSTDAAASPRVRITPSVGARHRADPDPDATALDQLADFLVCPRCVTWRISPTHFARRLHGMHAMRRLRGART